MNFAQVRQAENQKDQEGYPVKVAMFGQVQGVSEKKFDPKSGKPFQQISVTDDAGETCKVKIWLGKNPDMNNSLIGQRQAFKLSPYNHEGKIYYSGFWEIKQSVMQTQASQPHAVPPQTHQIAPQSNIDKDLHIRRGNALNAVMSATSLPLDKIGEFLNASMVWIETGKWSIRPFNDDAELAAANNRTPEEGFGEETDSIPF